MFFFFFFWSLFELVDVLSYVGDLWFAIVCFMFFLVYCMFFLYVFVYGILMF